VFFIYSVFFHTCLSLRTMNCSWWRIEPWLTLSISPQWRGGRCRVPLMSSSRRYERNITHFYRLTLLSFWFSTFEYVCLRFPPQFMDLRTRYTALVTLMTQYVKFAGETLKRAEEDEVRRLLNFSLSNRVRICIIVSFYFLFLTM